ncbi:uncharacterized protein si:ch211-197h24.6 [Ictalurus punctatus]|uniref:Uncharacterized protein si:ch211-197h24.6 n=1 Tax=Ictalurus punctatus TaxID=7998 RepID=A0A2D0PSM0_ICTPU|nr:uncharacterized protein si:ch211-197h24.6 [Ictalurus punctatus]XP_017309013.1 uncharacterized protein si:ch211-197h24.6 [Ictalurus punctatus]
MEASAQAGTYQLKQTSRKKKQQVYSGDIVFAKHGSVQTVPSLTKLLKTVTDPVLGLHYVWEYRSPSKSVPPHYQCRLCKVQQLQNEMVAHITGWKHCFRYLKHIHPEKVSHKEEEVKQGPDTKRALRAIASEVEKAEGRGQLKVVIREPGDVPVFQNMKSAFPSAGGPGAKSLLGPVPGGFYPGGPFGGGFSHTPFPEEFPIRGGMMTEFPSNIHGGRPTSGLSGSVHYDRMIGGPQSIQHLPTSRSMHMGSDKFGMGPRSEDIGRAYPDDLPMNGSDGMMRAKDQETSSTLTTLLRHLDEFRIDCEDDAQIVLKITQKLTDTLMEYRIRTISSGSRMDSSHLPLSSDRFSESPSRFYN